MSKRPHRRPPLQLTAAAAAKTAPQPLSATLRTNIDLLQSVAAECAQQVHYQDGGYVLRDGTRCTGLLKRLASRVPGCTRRDTPKASRKHPAQWRAPARSSIDIGKRIDRELVHVARCLRGLHGLNVEELAGSGQLPACFTPAGTKKPALACSYCGLKGKRYTGKRPRWHRWTLAYLRDLRRKGMRLVVSQVPVADASIRVATEVDDILVDGFGNWVVVERKSGYMKATDTGVSRITVRCAVVASQAVDGSHRARSRSRSEPQSRPPRQASQTTLPHWTNPKVRLTDPARHEQLAVLATSNDPCVYSLDCNGNKVIYISSNSGSGSSSEPPPLCADDPPQPQTTMRNVELPASEHTLHQLQVGLGADMFAAMATATQPLPLIRRCVVYVSGRSKIQARDRDGSLECVWVWEDSSTRAVAASLLPTL